MFEGARNFFIENVLANYEEFLGEQQASTAGESRDLRRAMNAAIGLSHMREHMPHPQSPEDTVRLCPEYGVVRDIADVHKHHALDRKSAILAKADCLSELIVVTEYEDSRGPFRTLRKTIIAELRNGSKIEVQEPFLKVLNFWIRELNRLGIVSTPERTMPPAPVPTRHTENGAAQLELRMRRGERFHQSIVYKRHNPATGIDEVVDLSGATARLNIRPIVQVLTFTLRKNASSEEVEFEIPLLEEQARHLEGMRGDVERSRYLVGLVNQTQQLKDYVRQEFGKDDITLVVSDDSV